MSNAASIVEKASSGSISVSIFHFLLRLGDIAFISKLVSMLYNQSVGSILEEYCVWEKSKNTWIV